MTSLLPSLSFVGNDSSPSKCSRTLDANKQTPPASALRCSSLFSILGLIENGWICNNLLPRTTRITKILTRLYRIGRLITTPGVFNRRRPPLKKGRSLGYGPLFDIFQTVPRPWRNLFSCINWQIQQILASFLSIGAILPESILHVSCGSDAYGPGLKAVNGLNDFVSRDTLIFKSLVGISNFTDTPRREAWGRRWRII